MSSTSERLWPFTTRMALVTSVFSFTCLLIGLFVLRSTLHWFTGVSEGTLLLGILILSAIPVLLCIFDNILARGGTIEYKGIKINLAQVPHIAAAGFAVPIYVGVPGKPITDSDSKEIISALQEASSSDIVVVNLEEGKAWWETRLLVLIAGAARRNKPARIVFVATDHNIKNRFQGWGQPDELLEALLSFDDQYRISYHAGTAAAKQWQLVEPNNPARPGLQNPASLIPLRVGLANGGIANAFDSKGIPNDFLAEQLMALDLGQRIEALGNVRMVTLSRLKEVFSPVLHDQHIELRETDQQRMDAFFDSTDDFIAITENHQYNTMVSRLSVLNQMMKDMVKKN